MCNNLKAYDSVFREGLYQKLKHLGFGGRVLTLIRTMYHVRGPKLEVEPCIVIILE